MSFKQLLPMRWQIGRWLQNHDLIRADRGQFRVLIADLEGDDDLAQTKHLAMALAEQPGLAVMAVGQIPLPRRSGRPDRAVAEVEEQGWNLLAAHDSDILIHGQVAPAAARLRLDILSRYEGGAGRHGPYQLGAAELPKRFGPDLEGQLLVLIAAGAQPACHAPQRRAGLVALLRPAMRKVSRVLEHPPANLAPDQLGALWHALGLAACMLGEQGSDRRWLESAVRALRTALQLWRHDAVLFDRAMAQNNLGHALSLLAEAQPDQPAALALLGQAVDALEEALRAFRAAAAHDLIRHTEANLARVEAARSDRSIAAE